METVNTFTKGLVSDKHPLTIGQDTMTDALNATLITYNGNEMILQNDMGNSRLAVPESTKQVRLTIYQKTDDATSKGYNTDVNDIKDRLSDADISLRSAFKPIGVVEHGGILYIASQRDVYNDKGEKEGTEFEIGSFPGPDFTNNDTQWHYEIVKDTLGIDLIIDNKINLECLSKVYILVDSANSEQITFKPGMPIYISVGDSNYKELITIGENRKYFKINFLNLLDNNRNITKKIEHCIEYDVSVSDTALKTFYFPNIKNTQLGFNLELENIDSFLIHPIDGTSEEEQPYNTLNVPFLIDPNFPEEVKNKYYSRKPESQIINPECFYLYFDLFDIIQPSSVKADSYTIRYSLTNKNGDYIKIENDEQQILNNKFTVEERRIFSSYDNPYQSNQALLVNIGKNKDVTITFTIYPEQQNDSYFTVSYSDVPYHFEPYKIQMTIDLWLSPGLWNGLPQLVQNPQNFEAEFIDKKINFDSEDEVEYKLLIKETTLTTDFGKDFFVNYRGDKRNLFDSKIKSKERSTFITQYIGHDDYLEYLRQPTQFVIDKSDKVDLSSVVTMNDKNFNQHLQCGGVYNDENTHIYKSGLGIKHKAGFIVNLNYFANTYDLKLACSGKIKGVKNSARWGNRDAGPRSLYLEGVSGGCELSIGDSIFQSCRALSKLNCPSSPWPWYEKGHFDLVEGKDSHTWEHNVNYVDFSNEINQKEILTNKNSAQEIWCGGYSPTLMAVIHVENEHTQNPYKTQDWKDDEIIQLDPYLKANDSESGIEQYRQEQLNVDAYITLKNKYEDMKLWPLLYLTQVKDEVEYLVSTQGKIHIQNSNLLLGKMPSTNYGITSIPYTKGPYNAFKFPINGNRTFTFEIKDDITKTGYGYYLLQFYTRTLDSGNSLYIEVYSGEKQPRGQYPQSIVVEGKTYNQGTLSTETIDYHEYKYNIIKINKQYQYIQIPINITNNKDIQIHICNPSNDSQLEIRNLNLQKKMDTTSNYEVKGAVVTYEENVDLININNTQFKLLLNDNNVSDRKITSKGIYLPCQSGYYEIYTSSDYPNGTFKLNKDTDGSVDTTIKVGNNSYNILHG